MNTSTVPLRIMLYHTYSELFVVVLQQSYTFTSILSNRFICCVGCLDLKTDY